MSEGLIYCISPVLYHDVSTEYSYRRGTAFYTQYSERLFAITASHCIEKNDINNLFLGLNPSKRRNYKIPLNKQINVNYTDGAEIDSDIRIFEIDQISIMKNLAERTQIRSYDDMVKEIRCTPLAKRLLKKYKNQPEKFREALMKTTMFKTIHGRQLDEIEDSLEKADTSLADIKTLELTKDIILQPGDPFAAVGFPTEPSGDKLKMTDDGKITGWHFSYAECDLTYIETHQKCGDYVFSYDKSLDLNGFSGGPVVGANNKVIGVLSWGEKEKGLVYVTPSVNVIKAIDSIVKNTPDEFSLCTDIPSGIEQELLKLIYKKID